jgi:hypothetical protein
LHAQTRGPEEAAVVSYGNDIDENNPKNKNGQTKESASKRWEGSCRVKETSFEAV